MPHDISQRTLNRLGNFHSHTMVKRAILMYIAHRCNESEINKYRDVFLKLDKEKRGYVTFDALLAWLKTEFTEEQIGLLFKSMDLDSNNKIYWSEFVTATISHAIYLKEENLKEAFNHFDREGKGFFNLQDMKISISDPDSPVSSVEIERIFKEAFRDK